MARLPSLKRIYKADYPKEFQSLVDNLSLTINNGFDNLYNALNNRLTIRDNFLGSVKDVIVSVDSNGIPTSSTQFTVSSNGAIEGLQVIQAINLTNSIVYPTGGIFISYTQNGNSITINHVTGLPVNNQFSLRIIAYGT